MAALILVVASLAFFWYVCRFDEEGSLIYSALVAIVADVALFVFFIWLLHVWN